MRLACLLALTEADQSTLAWWVIGALVATGPSVYYWLKVIEHLKGRRHDFSHYATKAELADLKAARDAQIRDTFEKLQADLHEVKTDMDRLSATADAQSQHISEQLQAIHRSLGRLEGPHRR